MRIPPLARREMTVSPCMANCENAARQIARIATGWRLRPIADPLIVCTHAQTPEAILAPKVIGPDDLSRCHDIGAALAMGMASGIF